MWIGSSLSAIPEVPINNAPKPLSIRMLEKERRSKNLAS
jgi:hypothetical protein